MLVAEGLRKRYRAREVVRDFGLSLKPGEVVGLLGPNGAGKTTTVEMCEGFVRPDAGTIEVLGLDPIADNARLRTRMGVMLQSGLDISKVITHRFDVRDFEKGFEAMNSAHSGKVILDWQNL